MRNKRVRDAVIRLIGGLGVHVTDRAAPLDVQRLIRSLRPVNGDFELIRLGPEGDGGYLVPDDLAGIEYAFSPGVQTESGFEAALAARGMRVFLADFSVDGPAQANPSFSFLKKYIGAISDDTFMTLDEWKGTTIGSYDGDLLLQMDIEGGEFDSLLSASPALLAQFRIMVIEFHSLQDLFNKPFFDLASRLFQRLLQTHSVVHIHPNNYCGSVRANGLELPRVAEFTFHRNDRFRNRSYRTAFPHPLDRHNSKKAPLLLPACWYE
jgi:hypothetical protein